MFGLSVVANKRHGGVEHWPTRQQVKECASEEEACFNVRLHSERYARLGYRNQDHSASTVFLP